MTQQLTMERFCQKCMPYRIKKQGNKWVIVRKIDNKVVGHSDSAAKAAASVRARMSGEKT